MPSLRIALFTHDAYGLGHVRRSSRILAALAEREPTASLLLITGSPATHLLQALPPNADTLKIPTIVTSGAADTKPPTLDIGVAELASLRGAITQRALEVFEPDVFLVDNFPLGTRLELLPVLRALRHRPTRTVVGLRDVVDPPKKVRKDWARDDLYGIIERLYDRVLVYGMQHVLDAVDAYGLSAEIDAKLRYCGYVTEAATAVRPAAEVRAELDLPEGFLLATVGGGGDGRPLLETFLEARAAFPDRPALVATGEFMAPADREALRVAAAAHAGVRVVDHLSDLPSVMAAAGAVVAMGGYNTSAEILSVGARAVLVPRSWRSGEHGTREKARVDEEQLVRAEGLARLGAVDFVHPRELDATTLAEALRLTLARERSPTPLRLDLDGAGRVADELLELASKGR